MNKLRPHRRYVECVCLLPAVRQAAKAVQAAHLGKLESAGV